MLPAVFFRAFLQPQTGTSETGIESDIVSAEQHRAIGIE